MKKILSISFLFSFIVSVCQQQTNLLATDAFRAMGDQSSFGMMQTKKNLNYSIEGTTYFNETLSPGKIKMFKNDDYIENLELRYNIFYELLEVRANGIFFATENDLVSEFVLTDNGETHKFYNSKPYAGDLIPSGFIRVIYDGEKISVFAKDVKNEKKYDSSEPYSSIKNLIKYTDATQYYIFSEADAYFIKVKSRKKLMERFPILKNFGKISGENLQNEVFLKKMAIFMEK